MKIPKQYYEKFIECVRKELKEHFENVDDKLVLYAIAHYAIKLAHREIAGELGYFIREPLHEAIIAQRIVLTFISEFEE